MGWGSHFTISSRGARMLCWFCQIHEICNRVCTSKPGKMSRFLFGSFAAVKDHMQYFDIKGRSLHFSNFSIGLFYFLCLFWTLCWGESGPWSLEYLKLRLCKQAYAKNSLKIEQSSQLLSFYNGRFWNRIRMLARCHPGSYDADTLFENLRLGPTLWCASYTRKWHMFCQIVFNLYSPHQSTFGHNETHY